MFLVSWLAVLAGCGAFVVTLPFVPAGDVDLGGVDLAAPGGPIDGGAEDLSGAAPDAADLAIADLVVLVFLDLQYCWGGIPGNGFANCPVEAVLLSRDGSFGDRDAGGTGQWALLMNGAELYMDVDGSTITYRGVRMMDGCCEGTMGNNLPVGPKGTFRACFR